MELIQKHTHKNRMKSRVATQIVLDDDFNVPDSKPDAVRIINEKCFVELDQKKALTGRLVLSGEVKFRVLYVSSEADNRVQYLRGSIPLEESVNMENLEEMDNVEVRIVPEDFQVSLINSRKISLKVLLNVVAECQELSDEAIVVDLEAEDNVYTKKEMVQNLNLLALKKDTLRIRETLTLENGRPNIYEMLWEDVKFSQMDIQSGEGELTVRGNMEAFVLYAGEEEGHGMQWVTATFPIERKVDCQGAKEGAVCDIKWAVEQVEMSVAPDYDGEERCVHIDGILGLNIRIMEEEETPILTDAYSTAEEVSLKKAKANWESLLLNNESRVRVNRKLKLREDKEKIEQSCHATGNALVEQVKQSENGLDISGSIMLNVLYMTVDGSMPFDCVREKVPFSLHVDADGIDNDCEIFVRGEVEQVEVSMNSAEELEAVIGLQIHTLILCKPKAECVVSVDVQSLDMERLQNLPGMVGYMVQPGDSLWEIAKENHTTVDKIMELNDLSQETIRPGQKLIILKAVSG